MADDKTQSAKKMDVRYVANLARLNLSEAEAAQFQTQLDVIVEYFNQLRPLDVEGVEPMAHATPIQNVFREDEVRPGLDREVVLNNAPEHSADLIRVPTIVE
ncbi:MAG: Asp-tRNA(Asn)/Glu-tRNA(Gln) amidotransferase subunit GatC [bacterium]